MVMGRTLDQDALDKKKQRSAQKKHSVTVDGNGNKILITEEGEQAGRVSPTNISEQSEEAVCKICWGTEAEDRENNPDGEEDEPNPLISPCKCTGTQGTIHLKCLRSWLETKR